MGILYLESDLGEIYEHFQVVATLGVLITRVCGPAAYLISRRLQELSSKPILALATTAATNKYNLRA